MSKTCLVCPEISQASCFCQTPSLQFCEKHLSKHIITPSLVKHKPVYNKTANNNNQKIAIASLNSTKQKMRQMQSQIVNETSVLIAKLESQSKIFLKMLQKLSKKINFTIKTILNSSSADISTTPENIKNILFVLSEKELRNLAKSWNFTKFEVGASGFAEAMSNLVTFKIDDNLLDIISGHKKDSSKSTDNTQVHKHQVSNSAKSSVTEERKSIHDYPNVKNVSENIYEGSPRKGVTPVRRSSANPSREEQSGVNVSFKTAEERLKNQDNYPSVRNQRENVSHKRNSSGTSGNDITVNRNTSNSPNKLSSSTEQTIKKSFINVHDSDVRNTPSLTCKRNHKLVWNNNTPYQYYATSGSFMVTCNLCQNTFSCGSWNCKECNYNLCRNCCEKNGISLPLMACNAGHELEWKTDVDMLIRERNLPSAVCSSCEIQTPGPHWHCRPCMFDVCIGCGEQQGYISPATSAKCKNKHLLSTTYTNESVPCLMCKNIFSGNCYLCVDCKYVICGDCQNYLKCPAPGHPIVRCPEKHLLRWYQEDSFICDGCGQRKIEERFSCIECEYDMCADCSSYLIDSVSKTGTRCCQKRHKLLWCFETNALYSGQPYNCGVCNRKYKRIGSYRCNECELDICFKCMAKQT